jgi:hypothetical protein
MKQILLLFILGFGLNLQAAKIRDINIQIDSSNFGITNTFAIKVFLIKKNGKQIVLHPGSAHSKWSKVKIYGTHILTSNNGRVAFNQTNINAFNNQTEIEVSYNEGEHIIREKIRLPYVKGLIIMNNTVMVNHLEPLNFHLIFNNGRTKESNASLFDFNTVINESPYELNLIGGKIMYRIDAPVENETVEIKLRSQKTQQVIGQKNLLITYPTTCEIKPEGIHGVSGRNGVDGRSTSQNGGHGQHGAPGGNGVDVHIFARVMKFKEKDYMLLQIFYADGRYESEVLLLTGQPIFVSSKGGNGGNGGNGGSGAPGKIDLEKDINSPLGGDGGNGGNAGNGGDAGEITLYYLSEQTDITSLFQMETNGGVAGTAGVAGLGGKGDNSQTKLIGVLLGLKEGKTGQIGAAGTNGKNAIITKNSLATDEEFNNLWQKHLEQGFVK